MAQTILSTLPAASPASLMTPELLKLVPGPVPTKRAKTDVAVDGAQLAPTLTQSSAAESGESTAAKTRSEAALDPAFGRLCTILDAEDLLVASKLREVLAFRVGRKRLAYTVPILGQLATRSVSMSN